MERVSILPNAKNPKFKPVRMYKHIVYSRQIGLYLVYVQIPCIRDIKSESPVS